LDVLTSSLFLSFDLTRLTWLNKRSTAALDQGNDKISMATLASSARV